VSAANTRVSRVKVRSFTHGNLMSYLFWRHVVLNTRNSWLHGDPRGFRDRHHRIHSSGDYHNPPPAGQHAGLHAWYTARAGEKVVFERDSWSRIGLALRQKAKDLDRSILAIAVGPVHVHLVIELPSDLALCRSEIGFCKRAATDAVKDCIRGKLWAQGGSFRVVRDKEHLANSINYVVFKQHPAWTWNYRDGERYT